MPPPSTDPLPPTSPAQQDSTTGNPNLTPEQIIQREKKVVCMHPSFYTVFKITSQSQIKEENKLIK